MTTTVVLHPIIKALLTASTFLGTQDPIPQEWISYNKAQQQLLEQHGQGWKELSIFSDSELKGFASKDFKELNALLRKEGFSIQLDESLAGGDAFGAIAILDVLINWQQKGREGTIQSQNTGQNYPGVIMERESDDDTFSVFSSPAHEHLILRIKTKSDDIAWITIADKQLEGLALLERIKEIGSNSLQEQYDYTSARFPMVDLDRQEDIGWLEQMKHDPSGYFIAQALQQTKFKMNHEGAHVKSAAAIGMLRSVQPQPKKEVIIDQPFYIWIQRPGASDPYFAGHISEENWQNPGNLDFK